MKGIVVVAALVLVAALVWYFTRTEDSERPNAEVVATSTTASQKLIQPKKLPRPDPKAPKNIFNTDPNENPTLKPKAE